jgi:hypothetical protein
MRRSTATSTMSERRGSRSVQRGAMPRRATAGLWLRRGSVPAACGGASRWPRLQPVLLCCAGWRGVWCRAASPPSPTSPCCAPRRGLTWRRRAAPRPAPTQRWRRRWPPAASAWSAAGR